MGDSSQQCWNNSREYLLVEDGTPGVPTAISGFLVVSPALELVVSMIIWGSVRLPPWTTRMFASWYSHGCLCRSGSPFINSFGDSSVDAEMIG